MNLNELMKRKSYQIALIIFSLLLGAYTVCGLMNLVHQRDTREVTHDVNAAVDELQKSPPGVERAEVFVKRLKAIDPGYAPAEVKQALNNYILATEQGLNALKAGQDNRQTDDAMAEARDRLIESLKKWD